MTLNYSRPASPISPFNPTTMLAKYRIDFALPTKGHKLTSLHQITDDPVTCESILADLLERGFRIHRIAHEGVELSTGEADRMLQVAAGIVASRHLCSSLGIDSVEAKQRFGTPA